MLRSENTGVRDCPHASIISQVAASIVPRK